MPFSLLRACVVLEGDDEARPLPVLEELLEKKKAAAAAAAAEAESAAPANKQGQGGGRRSRIRTHSDGPGKKAKNNLCYVLSAVLLSAQRP